MAEYTNEGLRALGKSIIFQFVDETHGKYLGLTTKSGLLVATGSADQKDPKWGKVLAVGPKVDENIKPDQYILIEPLAWTIGMYIDQYNGERVWRTDDTRVMAVSDEKVLSA